MSGRRWDYLAIGLSLLVFGWLLWSNRFFFHDDAYISLRYARHLEEFGVIEWNLGERVEGYTNFLHLVLASRLLALGTGPELATRLINAVSVLAILPALVLALRVLEPTNGIPRALAIVAVAASPGLAIWLLGGLETVMVAALIAWGSLGLILVVREGRIWMAAITGLIFGLAVLTRMDSAVFIAGAGLSVVFLAPGSLLRRVGLALCVAALPAAVAFLHMAWRLDYYGLPFPLTFYAKTGVPLSQRLALAQRLPEYVVFGLPLLFLALAAAAAALRQRNKLALALLVPVLLQIAYVVWSGGDHMAGARVVMPLVVPAALLLVAPTQLNLPLAGAAAVLSLWIGVTADPLKRDPAAFIGTLVGKHVDTWPAGQVISLATAGSTPFHADNHVYIDQLGLNDPVIARRNPIPYLTDVQIEPGHSKGDGAYILSREPDVIIIGAAEGRTADAPVFLSDIEMVALPEFHACYSERRTEIDVPPDVQRLNPKLPGPLTFIWYARTCPKSKG